MELTGAIVGWGDASEMLSAVAAKRRRSVTSAGEILWSWPQVASVVVCGVFFCQWCRTRQMDAFVGQQWG